MHFCNSILIQIIDKLHDCGFKGITHFCRYFKSNIGVTPREYRNNQLSAIGENQPAVEEYEEMYASFFKEIKDREERD